MILASVTLTYFTFKKYILSYAHDIKSALKKIVTSLIKYNHRYYRGQIL